MVIVTHPDIITRHVGRANQFVSQLNPQIIAAKHLFGCFPLVPHFASHIHDSQRLLKRKEGKGRSAAIEILINSPLIKDLILKGDLHEIKPIMKKSRELGMQTFDQALFDLYESDAITYDDAMRYADSMNELRLRIKLEGRAAKAQDSMAGLDHLTLTETDEQQGGVMR